MKFKKKEPKTLVYKITLVISVIFLLLIFIFLGFIQFIMFTTSIYIIFGSFEIKRADMKLPKYILLVSGCAMFVSEVLIQLHLF